MKTKNIQPKLTLVGAGPGDPDLLTIKGFKALKEANVVLFDALVNRELLHYAPKNAQFIFVGKRRGFQKYSQEQINSLIVDQAFSFGHVVRLKGGDPFIFGRGAEEIAHATNFGIPVTVVPGISSSMAVPAYQGIALTQRTIAQSFWVLTGTTAENELSKDIVLAAKSTATVVVLMGMSKLSKIIQLFQTAGRHETPVAIIQNGTTQNEKIGIGTIATIESVVRREKLAAPAIIVVGEVVRHSHQLKALYKNHESVIA